MGFSTIKGFRDILPEEVANWQRLESRARRLFHVYGFQEIRPPLLEYQELFSRSIGEETDIVSKQMYSFQDSKGRGLALRPEATASVVRAYIQHNLYKKYPVQKLFSTGAMFRHENPQKGRFRQFHQINAELFGDPGPKSDADIIHLVMDLFRSLGLTDLILNLNSLGCPECRPRFRAALTGYLADRGDLLCPDCKRRARTNPLRVFDCKKQTCQEVVAEAPSVLEFLCDHCINHFHGLQEYLGASDISFVLNHHLVRGLDYYTRTTFEVQTESLGAQNAVAGGGRYDGLIRQLGGPDHPGIGFAIGVERVIELLEKQGRPPLQTPDIFVAALGKEAEQLSFGLAQRLRKLGAWVETNYGSGSLKSQMKRADRLGAKKVLIIGEDELSSGKALWRDMATKEQGLVDLQDIENHAKRLFSCAAE